MFRQTYQTMYSRIQPDKNLLADTKKRMCSLPAHGTSKINKMVRFGAVAACLLIVAAAASVLKPGQQPKAVIPAAAGSSSGKSSSSGAGDWGIQTELQNGKYEAVVRLSNGVLNFIDSNVPQVSAKLYFDPKTTHEEEWTQEQAVKYLGKDVRPGYLPEVFAKTEQTAGEANQFVIMNNDGTVAYDNISYYYNGDPDDIASPSLEVKASKGKLPRDCVLYRSNNQTESSINGHKVAVGHEKIRKFSEGENSGPTETEDLYFSEFLYDGIGYRLVSKGLPQEEFVKVLISVFQ